MDPVSTASIRAFGVELKRFRRAARMTQAQLAERAGFSVVYISMLERGARTPQRATVLLLADALDLSGDERAMFEASAQTLGATRRQRGGDDSGSPHLSVGGFLGALPAGPLVGRERELAMVDEALARTRAMPYPYSEAKTLWAYGQLEMAHGDPLAARKRFTAALAICDRLGEGPYRKRIERDLAALNRSTGPARP